MQQLNSSDSSGRPLSWSPAGLAPSAVLGLCCVLGVPGNVAVLVVLGRRLRGGSFTLWMMLSLAVSDLLSLLTLPLWITGLLRGWIFGSAVCKLLSYLVYGSLFTSVLSVTLLSVQRYIQVLYSQRWARLGPGGQRVLLGGLWVLGGLLALPYPLTRDVVVHNNLLRCQRVSTSDEQWAALLMFEVVSGFVVPFSIMACFYTRLHRRVNQTAFFSSRRMTRLVTSIVVTFFVFYVPVQINNILRVVSLWLKSDTLNKVLNVSWDIIIAMTFVNSCVNPFLYAFSSQALRRTNEGNSSTQQNASTSNL